MAKDLNKVMIIGRLGTEPDMRHTSSGSPVATFRVAVSRQWRDSSGDSREETEWFSIVAWNKLAEICHQYLGKNTRVYIEGRLQTRSWEDQQSGQTRYKTEVVANDMIILDSRAAREHAPPLLDHHAQQPTRNAARPAEPETRNIDPPDIGDEDIPF
jgi:single-strand DNA-binding protein